MAPASTSPCDGCDSRSKCRTPCRALRAQLYEPGEPFEKRTKGDSGRSITIVHPLYNQLPVSAIMTESEKGTVDRTRDNVFSDEAESVFSSFNPKLKRTGIFFNRFFGKRFFEDLAMMYDCSESAARVHYSEAVRLIMKNLDRLDDDGRNKIAEDYYRERCGKLPKNVKYFLMAKLFGITPQEIAEIDGGTNNRNVSSAICRLAQRVKAGKVDLAKELL